MEPRGRRSHQVYRMRKAVNFMAPMGFAADFVEKTVDSLLEEYEGPQGWRFIEEDSYSVLLERLLDGEEDTEVNTNEIDNAREVSTGHVSLAANDDAGPTRLPIAEDAATEEIESGSNGTAIGVEEALTSSSSSSLLARSSSVPPPPPPPRRQRKPCYGWISEEDSDDEEEEKVEPGTGTGTGTVEKIPFPLPPRKRHWLDERPNHS